MHGICHRMFSPHTDYVGGGEGGNRSSRETIKGTPVSLQCICLSHYQCISVSPKSGVKIFSLVQVADLRNILVIIT